MKCRKRMIGRMVKGVNKNLGYILDIKRRKKDGRVKSRGKNWFWNDY